MQVSAHRLISARSRQISGAVVALDAQQARVCIRGHFAHVRVRRILTHLSQGAAHQPTVSAPCTPMPASEPPVSAMQGSTHSQSPIVASDGGQEWMAQSQGCLARPTPPCKASTHL